MQTEIDNAEAALTMMQYHAQDRPTRLKASITPLADIDKIAYAGQIPTNRQYRSGYEQFFNSMPILQDADPLLDEHIQFSKLVMQHLGHELKLDPWLTKDLPTLLGFDRTIIGMEKPRLKADGSYKEGSEFVVARWGEGFTSPVHGHAPGYEYEEVLTGKIRVNSYRMVDPNSNVVRPVRTDIVEPGLLVSRHTKTSLTNTFKRQTLIHNFTAIDQSTSLHYLPEHTRDGRDNSFKVEYFDDVWQPDFRDVQVLSVQDGLYAQKGDVILVRSSNVPEYGDHYIVITGRPVMKAHGLRPQEVAIHAPKSKLLAAFDLSEDMILLKLVGPMHKRFIDFHGITIVNGEVIFPPLV